MHKCLVLDLKLFELHIKTTQLPLQVCTQANNTIISLIFTHAKDFSATAPSKTLQMKIQHHNQKSVQLTRTSSNIFIEVLLINRSLNTGSSNTNKDNKQSMPSNISGKRKDVYLYLIGLKYKTCHHISSASVCLLFYFFQSSS